MQIYFKFHMASVIHFKKLLPAISKAMIFTLCSALSRTCHIHLPRRKFFLASSRNISKERLRRQNP